MSVIINAGVIGAGKSSLTAILAKEFNSKAYYEPVQDNPVLPLFYSDPEKYAFLLQIYFLNKRFAMIKKAYTNDDNVLDRSIYEDSLFFHMNADMGRATKQEVNVYDDLLKNMMEELPYAAHKKAPDLMVFIRVSYKTMLKRIKKRGRTFEQLQHDPSLASYYQRLIKEYDKWYENYDISPKIMIDGDKYDFVDNKQDREEVVRQIRNFHDINRNENKASELAI